MMFNVELHKLSQELIGVTAIKPIDQNLKRTSVKKLHWIHGNRINKMTRVKN